jgi:pyrroline-5-carboxylate reductase
MKQLSEQMNVACCQTNTECAANSRYIILAVKPVVYPQVLSEIKEALTSEKVLISIAPGIKLADIEKQIDHKCRVVRAMPNTPALVGEGMTGISYDTASFSKEEQGEIEAFFASFGKVQLVEERLMSAVVCASGSSPAYVYMMIEALADGAVKCGMPRKQAYEFVAQTVLGAAQMVLETGEHPAKLKDNVCSPGGTTIAAVEALEANGFRNSLLQATNACYNKCEGIR